MPAVPHILIADDDVAIRGVLARVIAQLYSSVTLTAVSDGPDALAVFERHAVDLVITNHGMPTMDGVELTRTLRARPSSVPILLASADPTLEPAALAAGAARFLTKPFSLAALRQALVDLLPP